MFRRRGKILRLRPGLLGNFSGGAGYMPFVVMFSAPIAFVGTLVDLLVIHFSADATEAAAQHDLARLRRIAMRHLAVWALISAIAGALLCFQAVSMIYASDKSPYFLQALWLSLGPFAGWLIAAALHLYYVFTKGQKRRFVFASLLVYVVCVMGVIGSFILVSIAAPA